MGALLVLLVVGTPCLAITMEYDEDWRAQLEEFCAQVIPHSDADQYCREVEAELYNPWAKHLISPSEKAEKSSDVIDLSTP